MAKQELNELIEKHLTGSLSAGEVDSLRQFLREDASVLYALMDQQLANSTVSNGDYPEVVKRIKEQVIGKIAQKEQSAPVRHLLKASWFRYAAILLLIVGAATYLFVTSDSSFRRNPGVIATHGASNIQPGGNKAILTLADGSIIVLDSAANGALAEEGATKIIKLDEGSLAYNNSNPAGENIGMNTISTPRGGQYQVVLPDGSKVWLNAASSIRFPTAFAKDRKVMVTGEVYLEVVQNKAKPFAVEMEGGASVEVMGTSFNVNSYKDEGPARTTLVEGRVKVNKGNQSVMLIPGQQAVVNEQIQLLDHMNVDQVLAWKNGFFNLQNASLQQVMRQMERWYAIEVRYEGKVADINFQGKISRKEKLGFVLDWFETMGIRSRLDGNTLVLSAK